MKYYVYISDSKVDMLLAQIPHEFKRKVALQFKVIAASRTVETENEENRVTRLETVCEFIREYGRLGTADEPDEFFADELKMRWGPFGEDQFKNAPLVYFGGLTQKTVIGLGGSIHHVIGQTGGSSAPARPRGIPGSIGDVLLHYLTKELGLTSKKYVDEWQLRDEEMFRPPFVEMTTLQMRGPLQKLEFMAKRLLDVAAHENRKHILLGTPLYVAMAE
ncbi:MAG TPA: SAVMC3_10250 family protein [Pyrinomonadaceae bacterium]|nr:SAVMC3_10250 family protein [Pyrinomonadaceae bacterium]